LGFIVLMTLIAGVVIGSLISWLLWLWPANREKRYWQRQYNQLKQNPEFPQNPGQSLVDPKKHL